MPIICLPNCAYLSEVSRIIAIYRKLKELGADVIMASHGGTFEFELDQEGIPYERIEPLMSEDLCQRFIDAGIRGPEGILKKDEIMELVQSEMDFFREKEAAAVVTGFMITTVLSARGAGVPLVVDHLGSFVPPTFERKLFTCREAFDNAMTRLIPESWMNRLIGWMMLNMPFQLRTLNKVAKELNIEPVRNMFDMCMGDLTLVTDVPEILTIPEDEMEAWRSANTRHYRPSARLKYAGAIYAQLFGEVPEDVQKFLQTDKPKMFVALASSTREYIELVCNTLASMDVRAVLCSMVHTGEFGQAENILVKDYLPSHLVMPMCDLSIIHGGQGSVQSAIASGTPLIGFPLQPEQNFNIMQVERHGAALCMSLRNLRKGRLGPAIERVLNDESYMINMKKLQAFQETRDGPLEAAKSIIALVEA
jgi:UDP:flavonoid glycosyltransferase YjiC (YdhE family)